MTHKDIFTKFMIEYDKANVTSSYPSLTEYEIATFLDKAYMALIAQKVTGNNVRRAPFEADIKSISDLQALVVSDILKLLGKEYNQFPKLDDDDEGGQGYGYEPNSSYLYGQTSTINQVFTGDVRSMPDNVRSTIMPKNMLYFVSAHIPIDMHRFAGWMNDQKYVTGYINESQKQQDPYGGGVEDNTIRPMDNKIEDYEDGKLKKFRIAQVKLVNHDIAERFFASAYNIPWVKQPVAYFENNRIFVVVDPIVGIPELPYSATIDDKGDRIQTPQSEQGEYLSLTYIKSPKTFVKTDLHTGDSYSEVNPKAIKYVYENGNNPYTNDPDLDTKSKVKEHIQLWDFELNDVAAEELISLAITYALENVESSRLNAHLGIRGLES